MDSGQNPSMAALQKAQAAFAGEAERIGLKDEADVAELVHQERKKRQ